MNVESRVTTTADAASSGAGHGALTESLANLQGMAAQGLMMLSRVDREHLLQ